MNSVCLFLCSILLCFTLTHQVAGLDCNLPIPYLPPTLDYDLFGTEGCILKDLSITVLVGVSGGAAGTRSYVFEDVLVIRTASRMDLTYAYVSPIPLTYRILRSNFTDSTFKMFGGPLPPGSTITLADNTFTSTTNVNAFSIVELTASVMVNTQIEFERNIVSITTTVLASNSGVASAVGFGVTDETLNIALINVSMILRSNTIQFLISTDTAGTSGTAWLVFASPVFLRNVTIQSEHNSADIFSDRIATTVPNGDTFGWMVSYRTMIATAGSSITDIGSNITSENVPRVCVFTSSGMFAGNESFFISVEGSTVQYTLARRIVTLNPFNSLVSFEGLVDLSGAAQIIIHTCYVRTVLDLPVIEGADSTNSGLIVLSNSLQFGVSGPGTRLVFTSNTVLLEGLGGKGTFTTAAVILYGIAFMLSNSAVLRIEGNAYRVTANTSGVSTNGAVLTQLAKLSIKSKSSVVIRSETLRADGVVCYMCMNHILSCDANSEFEADDGTLIVQNTTISSYTVQSALYPLLKISYVSALNFYLTTITLSHSAEIVFFDNNLSLFTSTHMQTAVVSFVVQNSTSVAIGTGSTIRIATNIMGAKVSATEVSSMFIVFFRDVKSFSQSESSKLFLTENRLSLQKATGTFFVFPALMAGALAFVSLPTLQIGAFTVSSDASIRVASNWISVEAPVLYLSVVLLQSAVLTAHNNPFQPAIAVYRNKLTGQVIPTNASLFPGTADLVYIAAVSSSTKFIDACLNTRNAVADVLSALRIANAFPSRGSCGTQSSSIWPSMSRTERISQSSAAIATSTLSRASSRTEQLQQSATVRSTPTSLIKSTMTLVGLSTMTQSLVIPRTMTPVPSVTYSVRGTPSKSAKPTDTKTAIVSSTITIPRTQTISPHKTATSSISILTGCPAHCNNASIRDGEGQPCDGQGHVEHEFWGEVASNKNAIVTASVGTTIEFRGSVAIRWPSTVSAIGLAATENSSTYELLNFELHPSFVIVGVRTFYKNDVAVFEEKRIIRLNVTFGCEVNSPPIIFTVTLLPMPAPDKVLPPATVSSAAAVAIASGLGGAPDMQTVSLLGLSACAKGSAKTQGLALRSISPFATEESCEGALIGNCILVAAMVAVHSLIMMILKFKNGLPWLRAFDAARYPSFTLTVVVFTQNGFLLCGMAVGRSGNGWGYLAAAWTLFPIFLYLLLAKFLATRAYYPLVYRYHSRILHTFATIFLPSGELDQTVGGSQWIFSVVGKIRRHQPLWALCPHISFISSAPISLGEGPSCSPLYALSAILHFGFAILIAVKTPNRVFFSNALQVASLILNGGLIVHYLILQGMDVFSAPQDLVISLGAFAAIAVVVSGFSFAHIVFLRITQIIFGQFPLLKPFPASCAWESANWPLPERGITVFHCASDKGILEALRNDNSLMKAFRRDGDIAVDDVDALSPPSTLPDVGKWVIELEEKSTANTTTNNINNSLAGLTASFVSTQRVPAPLLDEILTDEGEDEGEVEEEDNDNAL